MKQLLLCAILGLSLMACTENAKEELADNQDALIHEVATSVAYHNYQSMLRETSRVMQETEIDYDGIKALMEETGRHFKEMQQEDFAHIEGAATLRWVQNRTAETIEPMKKLIPDYKELPQEIRLAILSQYHENRGINAMDLLSNKAKNSFTK